MNPLNNPVDSSLIETRVDVANFNKGRAITKDGITSETSLIQVPYVSENEHRNIVRHLGHYLKN